MDEAILPLVISPEVPFVPDIILLAERFRHALEHCKVKVAAFELTTVIETRPNLELLLPDAEAEAV